MQIKFAFTLGLIVIFDFVLDTSPRQNANKICFCTRLNRIFAEDRRSATVRANSCDCHHLIIFAKTIVCHLSIKCQRATERDNEKIELYDLVSASPLPAFCRGGLSLLPGADAVLGIPSAFAAPSSGSRCFRVPYRIVAVLLLKAVPDNTTGWMQAAQWFTFCSSCC